MDTRSESEVCLHSCSPLSDYPLPSLCQGGLPGLMAQPAGIRLPTSQAMLKFNLTENGRYQMSMGSTPSTVLNPELLDLPKGQGARSFPCATHDSAPPQALRCISSFLPL